MEKYLLSRHRLPERRMLGHRTKKKPEQAAKTRKMEEKILQKARASRALPKNCKKPRFTSPLLSLPIPACRLHSKVRGQGRKERNCRVESITGILVMEI